MRLIWQYVKKDILLYMAAPFFMMLSVFSDLLQPTFMQRIIDIGVAQQNVGIVRYYGLLMLGTTLLGLLSGFAGFYLSAKSSARTGTSLRAALFGHVLGLSYRELDTLSIPSLITRTTNDIAQVQQFLLSMQRIFVRAPFLAIGGLVMAISLSAQLSLIFIVILPLLTVAILTILRKAMRLFPTVQEKLDQVNQISRESLLGMQVVKGFSAEGKERQKFHDANVGLMTWQVRAFNTMILTSPIAMIVVNLSITTLLWFGGGLVHTGSLEVGKIMAFITYVMQILSAILILSMILSMISRAQASIDRINEVMTTENSIQPPRTPQTPDQYDIVVDDVSFRYYKSGTPVLDHVSFEVSAGETFGIIGPTGSGKSSLMHLIPRLYDTDSGEVRIGGVPVRQIDARWLQTHIGLIQQQATVLSGSLRDNLTLSNTHMSDEAMQKALDDAMATELYDVRHGGLDGDIQQRGQDLSGGQKQRVSIARVLAQNPSILMIDDSTSALDMLTEQAFLDNLERLHQQQTIIIIAQRVSTLMRCDRIMVLNEGRVEAIGTHDTLMQNSPVYRTIATSQLGKEVGDHGLSS